MLHSPEHGTLGSRFGTLGKFLIYALKKSQSFRNKKASRQGQIMKLSGFVESARRTQGLSSPPISHVNLATIPSLPAVPPAPKGSPAPTSRRCPRWRYRP